MPTKTRLTNATPTERLGLIIRPCPDKTRDAFRSGHAHNYPMTQWEYLDAMMSLVRDMRDSTDLKIIKLLEKHGL